LKEICVEKLKWVEIVFIKILTHKNQVSFDLGNPMVSRTKIIQTIKVHR